MPDTQVDESSSDDSSLPQKVKRKIDRLEKRIEELEHDRVQAPLLTIKDVAGRLNVHKRTVERIIDQGHLKPIWVRGQRRFEPEAVRAYIREHCRRDR
jgi:excisionase family DNA binding protein